MGKYRACIAAMVAALAMLPDNTPAAPADSYPARQIRLVVPYPPGGGNDVVGRLIAKELQEGLGAEVLVENRGGAGGTVGTGLVARSPADGYTLLINNVSLATSVSLFSSLPYHPAQDLAPVSIVGYQPNVLLASPMLKVTSVRELLALGAKLEGGLIYGSGGPGSAGHLATEKLRLATGAAMVHVPYRGLAPAMTGLARGRVEMVVATVSTAMPAIEAKQVRPLAVTGARRFSLLPNLPTMREAGVANYEVATWYAVLVPARTPVPIIARLNAELSRVSANETVVAEFRRRGLDTGHTSPDEALVYLRTEIESWAGVIRSAGINPR